MKRQPHVQNQNENFHKHPSHMTVTSYPGHVTKTTHRQQTADEDGRMAVESYNYRHNLCVLSKIYSSSLNLDMAMSK